jgi:hypothetical protein
VLGSQRIHAELTEQFFFRGGVEAKVRRKGWAANIATLLELLQKPAYPRILGLVCYVDGRFFV